MIPWWGWLIISLAVFSVIVVAVIVVTSLTVFRKANKSIHGHLFKDDDDW